MATQNVTRLQEEWDLVIRPQRGWWDLRLKELWQYRDLVSLLVWRNFVAAHKQTVLGPLWHFIIPVINALVFTVIFGNVAQLSTDGLSPFLFYMAGNTIWSYFSSSLTGTSNTLTANIGIFGKVYFPRLVVPIATVISGLISFGIRLGVFVVCIVYFLFSDTAFRPQPNFYIALLPVLLIIMAGLGLGIGLIISSLTIKYRDFQQILGFGIQFLMYSSPVIYPFSTVPANWRWLLLLNPVTVVIETFRKGFLGTSSLEPIYLLYSIAVMFVVLLIGVLTFNRVENTFVDTI